MSNKVVFFNFDFFHSFFIVVCSYLALGSCSDQRGGPRHLLLPRAREVPIQRVPSQPPAPRVTGQFSGYMSERASERVLFLLFSYLSVPPLCRSRGSRGGGAYCATMEEMSWVPHPRRQEPPRLPPGIQPHRTHRTHDAPLARSLRELNSFFYPLLLREDALPFRKYRPGNIAQKGLSIERG